MMKTLNISNLSDRFEVAYNRIDEVLKKRVNYYDKRYTVLLRQGAKQHRLINAYADELEQYGRLRNAIVHEKRELGSYIAEPHPEVVARIEKIADIFTKPNYAMTIATKKVITFQFDDSITTVIQGINQHNYSQYPVYRNKEFIGLLTAKDIVKWMAKYAGNHKVDLVDVKVIDILKDVKEHPIAFADKGIDIFEVEEIYEKAHMNKTNLEAVIITENGNKNEWPLGLITAWDLIEIDYTAD
ncbi:CBS domain-containing protein [Cytobacillus gottheilii]|uniref:CBS domain-containing protein n=1 Tax=Cytobacillus gottheilii TaxID=859144 RepID=UPI0021479133|nr:CBS domain-containing protein [Cytobacillus gottheilii]